MSYFNAKRKQDVAAFIAQRDQERRVEAARLAVQVAASKAWLADYHSRPRPTRFNWEPRWPLPTALPTTLPTSGDLHGQEIIEVEYIEGEYTELADPDAQSQRRGDAGRVESGGVAAGAGVAAAPGDQDEQGDRTSFTDQDRTPF